MNDLVRMGHYEKTIHKKNGKKKIEMQRDDYGINISFMKNGWQSTVVQIEDDMIDMLIDVINDFKKSES